MIDNLPNVAEELFARSTPTNLGLAEGDRAPDFDLPTDDGRVSLAGLKGKTVVLYFYPKDDTSGCTAEAQGFTAAAKDFAAANAGPEYSRLSP